MMMIEGMRGKQVVNFPVLDVPVVDALVVAKAV